MTTNTFAFSMRLFMNIHPQFDDDNFELWKVIFKFLSKKLIFKIWDILINGPFIHTFSFTYEVVNKLDFNWIEEDKRKVKLDFKFKHIFINEVWDTLEMIYRFFCIK